MKKPILPLRTSDVQVLQAELCVFTASLGVSGAGEGEDLSPTGHLTSWCLSQRDGSLAATRLL